MAKDTDELYARIGIFTRPGNTKQKRFPMKSSAPFVAPLDRSVCIREIEHHYTARLYPPIKERTGGA